MTLDTLAPIALFVYNRPEHTRKTVEALQKNILADESELFIFSDAPKNEAATEKVNEVRSYLHTISGFKSIRITERQANMGCTLNIRDGVSQVMSKAKNVIAVEDDILTSPYFLQHMNESLVLFENNDSIWSIAGYAPPIKMPKNYQKEIYLVPRFASWGWASWRDRWELIDWSKNGYEQLFTNSSLRRSFTQIGDDVMSTLKNHAEIWDNTVHYTQWKLNKYTVYPRYSLVKNIGADGSGVHFTSKQSKYDVELYSGEVKINPNVQPDERIIKAVKKFYTKTWYRKCMIWVAKKMKVYNMLISMAQKNNV